MNTDCCPGTGPSTQTLHWGASLLTAHCVCVRWKSFKSEWITAWRTEYYPELLLQGFYRLTFLKHPGVSDQQYGIHLPLSLRLSVPVQDGPHVRDKPQRIQHRQEVEQGRVRGIVKPRLYGNGVIYEWSIKIKDVSTLLSYLDMLCTHRANYLRWKCWTGQRKWQTSL